MKAAQRIGTFNNYDSILVPTSGIVGTANCEAGARFRYKNTWVMSAVSGNSTKDGVTGALGVLWKTPSQPYVLDYVALRFMTNITGTKSAGSDFATLGLALMLEDGGGVAGGGGNRGVINPADLTFVGATPTYAIASNRSLFSSVIDSGTVFNDFNLTGGDGAIGAIGGKNGGVFPVFHGYSAAWYNQDLWLAFNSEPTTWTLSGTVELQVSGLILG